MAFYYLSFHVKAIIDGNYLQFGGVTYVAKDNPLLSTHFPSGTTIGLQDSLSALLAKIELEWPAFKTFRLTDDPVKGQGFVIEAKNGTDDIFAIGQAGYTNNFVYNYDYTGGGPPVVDPEPDPEPEPEPEPEPAPLEGICSVPPALAAAAFNRLQFSENLISHHIDSMISANTELNRYFADLYVPVEIGSSTFQKVFRFESAAPPDRIENGQIYHPGADILVNEVVNSIIRLSQPSTRPEFNQKVISECPGWVMPYYLKTFIDRGPDQSVSPEVQTDTFHAFAGGISFEDFPEHNFFTGYQDAVRMFLSWYPGIKKVANDSQEYLYFLVNFTPVPTKLVLKANVTYTDDTCTQKVLLQKTDIKENGVYLVPAGPSNLLINTDGKTVKSYQIWLENATGERLSEIRSFEMDVKPRRNVKYFIFKNSLGAFDTVRTMGISQQVLTVNRDTVQKFLSWDYQPTDGEQRTSHVQADDEITVSTGWISQQVNDYLQDFYLSKEIYMVENGKFLPVQLTNKDLAYHTDDENLIAVKFKARKLYTKQKFSRMPAVKYPETFTSTKERTANCQEGFAGTPVTRSATRTSTISQAEADSLASAAAYTAALAELVCVAFQPDEYNVSFVSDGTPNQFRIQLDYAVGVSLKVSLKIYESLELAELDWNSGWTGIFATLAPGTLYGLSHNIGTGTKYVRFYTDNTYFTPQEYNGKPIKVPAGVVTINA